MILSPRRMLRTISAAALTPLLFGALCAMPSTYLLAQEPAAPTAPAPAGDATTYTLQRTYKAGTIDHYKMTMHNTVAGEQNLEMQFTMQYKESVVSIAPDGKVKLDMEFEKFLGNVNGQDLPDGMLPMMPKIHRTVDKMGQTLDMTLDGGQDMMNQGIKGMMQTQTESATQFLPSHPVKIGDSWDIKVDKPDNKTTGTAKLVGTEIVNGVKTLKITMLTDTKNKVASGPAAGTEVAMHFEGVSNFDPNTGQIVRMTGKGKGDSSKTGKIAVTIDLALLNGKDDKAAGNDKSGKAAAAGSKPTEAPASGDTKPKNP